MEPDADLDPDKDDLPLRANTNHILVRHYVLDQTVHFERKVISGSVVLFLEPGLGVKATAEEDTGPGDGDGSIEAGGSYGRSVWKSLDVDSIEDKVFGARGREEVFGVESQTAAETENTHSSHWRETSSDGDFTLVLDCCDLDVSKVEEVDVTSVSAASNLLPAEVTSEKSAVSSLSPQAAFIQKLLSLPSSQWRQKHQLFLLCSRAPGAQDGTTLHFQTDRWSLQVQKKGTVSPQEFPSVIRICYETRPTGGSVRWTKDQDNRFVSRCNSLTQFHKTVFFYSMIKREDSS